MKKYLKLLILPLCLLSSCNNTKKPTTINEEIENTTNLKVGTRLYDVLDKEKYNHEPSEYNNFQLLDNYAYILEDNMNILLFLDYDFYADNPIITEVHCYNKKTFPKENFLYFCGKDVDFAELIKYVGFPYRMIVSNSAKNYYYFKDENEKEYYGVLHYNYFSILTFFENIK